MMACDRYAAARRQGVRARVPCCGAIFTRVAQRFGATGRLPIRWRF
jgi:hypothetical protein